MNKRQAQRLLRVAKALRESPVPEAFDMEGFLHGDGFIDSAEEAAEKNWCGTPACALGHYAARLDLQRLLQIKFKNKNVWNEKLRKYQLIPTPYVKFAGTNNEISFDHELQNYFGVDNDQLCALFGGEGCGGAKTVKAAATYIERFVKNHYGSLPQV